MKQYIFCYGSLVSIESIELSLGHTVSSGDYSLAKLNGWQRDWTLYVSNNDKNVKRPFIDPKTKQRTDLLLRTLDVHPDKHSYINGAIYKVSDQDLLRLDEREDVYKRIDVTSNIVPAQSNSIVWSYRGKDEIRNRYMNQKGAVIPKSYYELVIRAFREIGQEMEFTRTTPHNDNWINDLLRIKEY